MSFIINRVKSTIGKAIVKFAKAENVTSDQIQIRILVKDQEESAYSLMKDYTFLRNIDISDVVGKIDLFGKNAIIGSFINNYLYKASVENNVPVTELRAMIAINDEYIFRSVEDKKEDAENNVDMAAYRIKMIKADGFLLHFYLYNKGEFIKEFGLEEIME